MDREPIKIDHLKKLRELILDAPQALQAEIDRGSKNTWLSCFGTRLTAIGARLQIIEASMLIPKAEMTAMKSKFQMIKTKWEQIRAQNGDEPTDDAKKELLDQLTAIYQ